MASSPRQKTRISNVYKIEVPDRALGKIVVKFEVHLCRKLQDGRTVNYQRRHDTQRAAELDRDRVIGEIRSGTYMSGAKSIQATPNQAAPAPSIGNDCTVAEALCKYLAYLDHIRSDGQPYRERNRLLFIVRQPIGQLPLSDLDGNALDTYIERRLSEGVTEATVKKEIAILRRMRRLAHRPALGLCACPATIHPNRDLRGSNSRTRRLESDEFERLVQFFAVKGDWQMAYATNLAVTTCMRLGELCALEWRWFDTARQVIRLPADVTKNRTAREVPLRTSALEQLQKMATEKASSGLILGGLRPNCATQRWRRATAALGIDNLTFHDLRHEGISRLAMLRLPDRVIMQFSGHKTASMLSRYVNLNGELVGADVRRLEAQLANG